MFGLIDRKYILRANIALEKERKEVERINAQYVGIDESMVAMANLCVVDAKAFESKVNEKLETLKCLD